MKHFDSVEAAHRETDRFLAARPAKVSIALGGVVDSSFFDTKYINDRAYFVLLVAQFETLVTDAVERLIDVSEQSADWRGREVWNALVPSTKRIQDIPFKRRLALLIDRQRVVYRDALGLYDARNKIAHGDLDGPLSIQTAINQLRAVASLIQEVP